jgi:hypothetical protein
MGHDGRETADRTETWMDLEVFELVLLRRPAVAPDLPGAILALAVPTRK